MLIDILFQEFNTYFDRDTDHDTILWFDPKREWEPLLPYLEPRLPLLVYEDSLLHLRYQLVNRTPGETYVVYLPFETLLPTRRGEAEYLRPLLYTAKVFDASIEEVLRDQGVELPDTRKTLREIRPHLSALAAASVDKGRAFWQGLTNLETVLTRLLPDFEDHLLRLLAYPTQTQRELERNGKATSFWNLVEGQFGVQPPKQASLAAWANRFTATLCLVDAYLATGKPEDFPFKQALPKPVHWEHCRSFLRTWQRDEMFNDAFARRARAIDEDYRLVAWVTSLPQPPETTALRNVAQAVWTRMEEHLASLSDKAAVLAFCRAKRETFRQRARGFWSREGTVAGWRALDRMADVVVNADDTQAGLSVLTTVPALVEHYLEHGWQIDRAYRDFRATLDQGLGQMDVALKWTQRIYRDYLDTLTSRGTELLMEDSTWPPEGMSLGAEALWSSMSFHSGGRRALIMVDALRYEMGHALMERLQPGPQVTLDAAVSTLPSVTQVGMAALLPRWAEFEVEYPRKRWQIHAPGFSGNLAEKQQRLAWLEQTLEHVAVFDLETWLRTAPSEIDDDVEWIIIASTEIDAVGEHAGSAAWRTGDVLLGRLEQAVRRLLAVDCRDIHVFSDHGFLLREDVRESEKVNVEVPADEVLKRSERYLLLRSVDAPPTDLPRMSVSGSNTLEVWFPRGTGCFKTPGPYDFMHGGPSLQEVITPHLTVRQSVEEHPVHVALELVAGPEIRNAIFKVRLLPEKVDLLSRPRRVTLDIALEGERISRTWEAVIHREPVETSLRLSSGTGVEMGDTISVRLWDTDTNELLGQQSAVVQVDLDW